jgi:hypothetical protein
MAVFHTFYIARKAQFSSTSRRKPEITQNKRAAGASEQNVLQSKPTRLLHDNGCIFYML